jgi:hypothetical protein
MHAHDARISTASVFKTDMYSVGQQDTVVELKDVPQSDVGAPSPLVISSEHRLLLAYTIQEKQSEFNGRVLTDADIAGLVERVALIEFERYRAYTLGAPNDETLSGHPLYRRGLGPYGAFEVTCSSWIRQLEQMNSVHTRHNPERFKTLRHFVFTFHDSTFECVAEGYKATEHEGPIVKLLPEMQMRLSL